MPGRGYSQILIVDDEQNLLNGLRRTFRKVRPQWGIHLANGVNEAEGVLSKETIDVIVCDVYMPGQDGFDLLKSLERSGHLGRIPVVMMTGMEDHDLKHMALEAGATDLLNKPVQTEDMVARVGNCLRLRRYTEQLNEQAETLRKQVRCLQRVATAGTLAAGCVHDLKNIVGIIPALLDAIDEDGTAADEDTDISLDDVRKCADQAHRLTKQILSVIRGDSMLRGECDVASAAADCISVLKHAIDPRVRLNLEIESEIPILKASPTDMMQLLLNLCVNAGEAITSDGAIDIRLRYDAAGSFIADVMGNEVLTMVVKDTGIGIPAEKLPQIFQPAVSTKRHGTGMGLAVVQNLVEKYNGKINVTSKVGEGTCFNLHLSIKPIYINES